MALADFKCKNALSSEVPIFSSNTKVFISKICDWGVMSKKNSTFVVEMKSQKKEFETYILPSGIKCILKQTKNQTVYCALMTNTGTRDELANEHGIAHFLEHMFFKGTKHRRPHHINSLLDNVGGELNAYTAKEETVVHSTVLKRDFSKAVDLISDVFYNSVFPQSEIDKERGVILDEINSYKDTPSEMIFDDFEDLVFAGSSLGRNILGTKKSLKKIRTEDFNGFIDRNYSSEQTVFMAMGNVSFARFKTICDKYLGHYPEKKSDRSRLALPEYTPQSVEMKKNTFQTHTILGSRAYKFDDSKRVALALFSNMLGGPSANSILNSLLREKHGLTYGVENNFATYSDTGIASIYFSCDKENHDKCMELIHSQLKRFRDNSMTSAQLSRAKKQLIGQLAISSDNNENYMLSSAKSFLMYGDIDTVERSHNKIVAISPSNILDVANEVFDPNNISQLIYR